VKVSGADAYLWATLFQEPFGAFPATVPGQADVHLEKDAQTTYLAVALPPAVETGNPMLGFGVNGEITIHYTFKADPSRKTSHKDDTANRSVNVNVRSDEDEMKWDLLAKHITDATVKQHVEQIFLAAFPGAQGPQQPAKHLVVDTTVRDHKPNLGIHHGALTRDHTVIDPRRVKLNADVKAALATTPSVANAVVSKADPKP
jgi:hypothetical protein